MEDWDASSDLALEAGLGCPDASWTDDLFADVTLPTAGECYVALPTFDDASLDSLLGTTDDIFQVIADRSSNSRDSSPRHDSSSNERGEFWQLGSGTGSSEQVLKENVVPAFKAPVLETSGESCSGVQAGGCPPQGLSGQTESRVKCSGVKQESESDSDGGGRKERPAEEPAKREERLIRNRESAQLSRQRRKLYVDELEGRLQGLTATLAELNTAMAHLRAENAALRHQLSFYCPHPGVPPGVPLPGGMYSSPYSMIHPGGPYAAPPVPIPRIPAQTPTPAKPRKRGGQQDGGGNSGKKRKAVGGAGAAVLALFCFAMVLGPRGWEGGQVSSSSGLAALGDEQSKAGGRVLMSVSEGPPGGASSVWTNGSTALQQKNQTRSVVEGWDKQSNNVTGALPVFPLIKEKEAGSLSSEFILQAVLSGAKKVFGARLENSKEVFGQEQAHRMKALATLAHGGPLLGAVSALPPAKHQPEAADIIPPVEPELSTAPQWMPSDGGLGGSILSSTICTELFQFHDETVSSYFAQEEGVHGSTVGPRNSSKIGLRSNATSTGHSVGRRFRLESPHAVTLAPASIAGQPVKKTTSAGQKAAGTEKGMVVSLLVPAPDIGSGDHGGVKGKHTRSLSQIFVVVLLESAKYVTYSCTIPTLLGG